MAKETVKVDNGLEEVKLKDRKEMEKKEDRKKDKKKEKKEKKAGEKKSNFLTKVKAEMKLVAWPTRKNVVKYSFATILMIVLMAGFFLGLTALFDLLYGLVQGWIG